VFSLLVAIAPYALGAAISPTLLMIEVFALSARHAPLAKGWMVALGATIALCAYAVFALLIGTGLPHARPHHALDFGIDLVAALLLGWLALRTWLRRNVESSKPTLAQRLDSASNRSYFVAGFLVMVTNFSTLILFFPAIRVITKSQTHLDAHGVALLVLMVVALLPTLGPVIVASLLGARADKGLARLNHAVTRHSAAISIGLEVVFFVYFALKTVSELSAL